jgi:hypothetical protein
VQVPNLSIQACLDSVPCSDDSEGIISMSCTCSTRGSFLTSCKLVQGSEHILHSSLPSIWLDKHHKCGIETLPSVRFARRTLHNGGHKWSSKARRPEVPLNTALCLCVGCTHHAHSPNTPLNVSVSNAGATR